MTGHGPVKAAIEGDMAYIRVAQRSYKPVDEANRLYRHALRHTEKDADDHVTPSSA